MKGSVLMEWLERLKAFKLETKETYKGISEKTGIPLTTIEKIFYGRTADPGMLKMDLIAGVFGRSVNDLLAHGETLTLDELNLLNDLRELDFPGINRVKHAITSEKQRMAAEFAAKKHSVLFYDLPVSAGTGQYLDHTTACILELKDDPPSGTDYVLRIAGDSMEPQYHDGDYVYVKKSETVNYGEVGIFSAQGNVYIKVFEKKGLKSLNPAYSIIPGNSDIKCLGKVLGRVAVID